jgi:nitrate reductase / nitrite oxidoreductase, alpha subunit
MSQFFDRLAFFRKYVDRFSNGFGVVTNENRAWEDSYRQRWQHDKIVRSTHGTNCTGSCSWKIYVKNGLVTWETQQTDYPRTRPDMPNHEPRGCSRGASFSWYLYSGNRLKYPLIRARLVELWREARRTLDPIGAWASIAGKPGKRRHYTSIRGRGGFVRTSWDEATEIIAAANAYTVKTYGPDRIAGFSPIPAMSMVSYAAGTRYLSLLGGTCLSFYDWYCDLPPSSPQTWGEQTDVPESADWYNSSFLILWGSNVPQTRTPDAHFYTEVRYKGAKSAVISPDYSEAAKFGDMWLAPRAGTDAALSMAMGHVILKEFHVDRPVPYFQNYCRTYTDMPFLVRLERRGDHYVAGRLVRASDFEEALGQSNNPDWKGVAFAEGSADPIVPQGSIGFRWGEQGKWNIEPKNAADGSEVTLALSLAGAAGTSAAGVAFPYFGGRKHEYFPSSPHADVLVRNVPARELELADGKVLVATVFDLLLANYGIDRGLGGGNVAKSYDDDVPYTPAWQETITGVSMDRVITLARQFAINAEKTEGRSMVILGAGLNHWYHMDMNYRGIINLVVMCGCVGKPGGGWSHYVGQEKLRPQAGWTPLAFALDWARPPRHMNATSYWYAHTSQWKYERLSVSEILSPLADVKEWTGSIIDFNVRAERMGWLPSSPQLNKNPIELGRAANASGQEVGPFISGQLKDKKIGHACEDPDDPANWPRNLFVWRSNLLGASGKGHEYFLKHLLGADNGVLNEDLGAKAEAKPLEVTWRDAPGEGKLDLMVTIDFRMNTTGLFSDIVLPTATWYEKNDMNTTDMHPFIHPLTAAVDPVWEARSDWDIFKSIAKKFSQVVPGHLGVEHDVVLTPLLHDLPGELGQALDVKDWKTGACEPVPGKTMPSVTLVERDYPNTYTRFTALGPLMAKIGNGGKGISWNTEAEVDDLRELNRPVTAEGPTEGMPKIERDIDAAETILMLAPETNGRVAVKAWQALGKITGRDHTHLALHREDERIRFRDIVAQPRKIISSPTWSGIESEKITYNAGWTNVHEMIPWRTLTGRQQFYQDHAWMRAFGESLCVYRPPIDTKAVRAIIGKKDNGNPEIVLNFITPHQKWGIHSTYTDNLLMLTLSRGGPIIWIGEIDARRAGIEDNDWVEAYNVNGSLTARAVVSQRIPEGTTFMYHAQEKMTNVPGSEITGKRGGIHNSVTRATMKPTHMIGGYAHLSYGFNYYGTVGSNRDEFVIMRKMREVDWKDRPLAEKSLYKKGAQP